MMNHWCGMGRLTKDPDLRTTPNGKSVANFTLAVDNGFGDKQETAYIDCVVWENRAETISRYVHKGNLIGVEGRISVRNYEDKQGNKRTKTEIVVSEFHFAESKKNDPLTVLSNEAKSAGIPVYNKKEEFVEVPDEDGDLPF